MSDPCPSYSCCCLPAHLTASSIDCGHSPLPVQYFMFNTFQDEVWDSVSVLLVLETPVGAGTATIISVLFIAPTHNRSMIPCGVISDSFASQHLVSSLGTPADGSVYILGIWFSFQKQKYIKKRVVIIISVLTSKKVYTRCFSYKVKKGQTNLK